MAQSHRLLSIALLAQIGLIGGCASKQGAKSAAPAGGRPAVQPSPNGSPRPVSSEPAPADPSDLAAGRAAELLAQQTAAYAEDMKAALAARQPRPHAPPAAGDPAAAAADAAATQGAEVNQPDPQIAGGPTAAASPTPRPAAADSQSAGDEPSIETQRDLVVPSESPRQATGPAATAPAGDPDPLERVAQGAKDRPGDIASQLDHYLVEFVRAGRTPSPTEMASLPAEDREILAALLDCLANFRDGLRREDNMLLSNKIQPLIELGQRLRTRAELTIPTVALCKRVRGFGVYDPVEPEFAAGREHPLIVYCEVQNFASQINANRHWETKLKSEVVLYTEGGLPVWQNPPPQPVTDVSRNRRNDFFVVERIRLPGNLTIGRYVMKVSIFDQHVHRIAEASLPVRIVAKESGPSLADVDAAAVPAAGASAASAKEKEE